MSTKYKHQEEFALSLAQRWLCKAERPEVRRIIRTLKNKAQAAYIAARVAYELIDNTRYESDDGEICCDPEAAGEFLAYLHPNSE